jgi:hypothetical protein
MPKTELNADLRYHLTEGPQTVKNLRRLCDRSETWVRDQLKAHADTVKCRKNTNNENMFWIDPASDTQAAQEAPQELVQHADEPEAVETPAEPQAPSPTVQEVVDAAIARANELPPVDESEARPDEDDEELEPAGCPLCNSTADQKPAGEAGTFLGACMVCSDCGKTWNGITRKEVKNAPAPDKAKRQLLNPQHKINLKQDAVAKAGGSVRYDKNDRRWVLEDKDGNTQSFTAQEFSVETPETLVAKLG